MSGGQDSQESNVQGVSSTYSLTADSLVNLFLYGGINAVNEALRVAVRTACINIQDLMCREIVPKLEKRIDGGIEKKVIPHVDDKLEGVKNALVEEQGGDVKRLREEIKEVYTKKLAEIDETFKTKIGKLDELIKILEAYKTFFDGYKVAFDGVTSEVVQYKEATDSLGQRVGELEKRYPVVIPTGDSSKRDEIKLHSGSGILADLANVKIPEDKEGVGAAGVVPESFEEREKRRRKLGYFQSHGGEKGDTADSSESDAEELERRLKEVEEKSAKSGKPSDGVIGDLLDGQPGRPKDEKQ